MILADSSVWIDYLRGRDTPQVERLVAGVEAGEVAIGDLMLVEVLQGLPTDRAFDEARRIFSNLDQIRICDPQVALDAARNYRTLRAKGVTIRKTIDTLIATRCIFDSLPLLFSDRDFAPFVENLGMVDAMSVEGPE